MSKRLKGYALKVAAVLLCLGLLAAELFRKKIFVSEAYGDMQYTVTTRLLGGLACMLFIILLSTPKMLRPRTDLKKFLVFLPCMAVAVNNFPFITFFTGRAYIDAEPLKIILYAAVCLSVGFFEEMAFRGCIFTAVLGKFGKRRFGVFISIVIASAVFGLVHLVNIFAGASVGATVLQIGYSFLIGGMCSVILVKTSNIWYCVLLHAVYNFAGGVVPECGGGVIWDTPTVVWTAVVGIAVAVYAVWLLVKIKPAEIDALR